MEDTFEVAWGPVLQQLQLDSGYHAQRHARDDFVKSS